MENHKSFEAGMQQEETSMEELKRNSKKMKHWYFTRIVTRGRTATTTLLALFLFFKLVKTKAVPERNNSTKQTNVVL